MITSPPWNRAPGGPVGRPGTDGWWAAQPHQLATLASVVPITGLYADGRFRRVPIRFDCADFDRLHDVDPQALVIGWGAWLDEIRVNNREGATWCERVHGHPALVPARVGRRMRVPLRWRHQTAVQRCRRWQWTGRRWPPA